jgi:hypothetical protein
MISSFLLKFGRTTGTLGQPINAAPVTVFVGPNNSGKSRVLAEIERYCRTGTKDAGSVILEDVTFSELDDETTGKAIEQIRQTPNPGESQHVDHIFVGSRYGRRQVAHAQLRQFIQKPSDNLAAFCQWFLTHNTLILDGQSRINLINHQPGGDLQRAPESSFQVLFSDDAKRHEVRRIIAEAFGTYFVLDPTNLGQLRIRLANRPPRDDMEERGLHSEAVNFHSQAQLIAQASDGVKAFTGIITEVIAGDPRVILVD